MLALLLAFQTQSALARVDDPIRDHQNIIQYEFLISIPDTGKAITGRARVHFRPRTVGGRLVLDFDDALTVSAVKGAQGLIPFTHEADSLVIEQWGTPGDSIGVEIEYTGVPADGLMIGKTARSRRAAFGDNWPDRARFWLPVEDHPSDKAGVHWTIEVPASWRAVANGRLVDTTRLDSGRLRWRYREPRPIPVYTYVIGAGEMTVTPLPANGGIPQSVWTAPEDSAFAVDGPFARVGQIVEAFTSYVGAFPYGKLAHVQSGSRFGGMENSSAIFYAERGYVNRTMSEGLVAHETAHQWFGDAVTEHDWHHLWLSEGFATYFAALFYDLIGERAQFRRRMEDANERYIGSRVVDRPILDFSIANPMQLLTANNYPKGAWVLHMLRHEVGDSAFARGIRTYYASYRDSTALSADLLRVMEDASGEELHWFFAQWLTQPGYPQLDVAVRRAAGPSGEALIVVRQTQPAAWGTFRVPVRIDILDTGSGARASVTIRMTDREGRAFLTIPDGADSIAVDPGGNLLATAVTRWDVP